jgi:hydroxymethylglutaryl-CoA lyase
MSENRSVEIVDVGPRDGLQDEHDLVSTQAKLEYIKAIARAGVKRIEVASFVSPTRIPQMADSEAVVTALRDSGIDMIGLVLNDRGMDRAIASGIGQINTVVAVSDTFSRENSGMSSDDAVAMSERVAARATAAGLRAGITLAAAFGCPFEGLVDPARVLAIAERAAAAGFEEIALADTIGAAVPPQTEDLVASVRAATGLPIRVHLHNSRNTGLANAVAALAGGASVLDASTGGIGGCPFAPGASGNIATEDLVHMLDRMGVATGVDVRLLLEAAELLETIIGRPAPGMLRRSGVFPKS